MVRKIEKDKVIECPRNGSGSMVLYNILTPEELEGMVTLIAQVALDAHSEIGYHQHLGETETYYVLSGEGIFLDGEQREILVSGGDICTIHEGQGHGLRNLGSDCMQIIAVVVKKEIKVDWGCAREATSPV